MTYAEIAAAAANLGFTHTGPLDPKTIQLKPEVRDMCRACSQHDKRWSCPPGCGSLESCAEKIAAYQTGILVQTTGQMEDDLDGEAMMETQDAHKAHFLELYRLLRQQHGDVLALGAGCCTQCAACTWPEEPCRFPDRMVSSMEAFGMVVTEVCQANGLPYYYGRCTITYTSCFLLG